ncbi:MAG: thioredoxin family protein [Bacteroidota bacterium]|nr:thioredoxin family protein [Bacteroidota bacterium]
MSKMYIFLLLLLIVPFFGTAQKKKGTFAPISLDQLRDSMTIHPKPILLRITTDWCVYCKLQDAQLAKDDSIEKLLRSYFYFTELDAESKEPVFFNGITYNYQSTNRVHELAEKLGSENGQIAYPVMIVLDRNYNLLYRNQGMLTAKVLYQLLKIFR